MATQLRIFILSIIFEKINKATNSIDSSALYHLPNFVQDLMWGLTSQTEWRLHIWVLSSSSKSYVWCKLLEVNFATFSSVMFAKNGCDVIIVEDTA